LYEILKRVVSENRIFTKEPLAGYTSFKIGGEADVLVQPASREELLQIIAECRGSGAAFTVLGHATNVLVPDEGLRGVVIQLYPHFCGCRIDGDALVADAGALLSASANAALDAGLTGLEFASGIPGTVGGAIVMNAGAYGHEMADVCTSADLLLPNGEVVTLTKDEMAFGYRTSITDSNGGIVLSASFKLKQGNREEIQAYMRDLNGRRRESQPLDYPSAGSTFKRPEGHFAGKLIEDSGLKGAAIGGAMVSEKHAGFVINTGNATAKDVTELMTKIRETVQEQYGVTLEPEVKILCNSK